MIKIQIKNTITILANVPPNNKCPTPFFPVSLLRIKDNISFTSSSMILTGKNCGFPKSNARQSHLCTMFHVFSSIKFYEPISLQHKPRQTIEIKLRELRGRRHILLLVNRPLDCLCLQNEFRASFYKNFVQVFPSIFKVLSALF